MLEKLHLTQLNLLFAKKLANLLNKKSSAKLLKRQQIMRQRMWRQQLEKILLLPYKLE